LEDIIQRVIIFVSLAPTKITSSLNFFCNISANTRSYNVRPVRRFCKVLRQINPYVSNKWPLKFPCAYLNTQESRHTGTPLIRIQGNIFSILRRDSFTLSTLVQYFVVLGNSIFLHFRPISNKLKKVVSFWKVLRHINAYVSNKWPLKFPCAYLNTQGSCTTGTPLIRIQGNIFSILRRDSFTLSTLVQYFVVLGNSIFLHFRPISNKLKKVVSLHFAMAIISSIY
ncbi:hypothetical protein T03_7286, partial [Trichinella britovi]